MAYYDNSIRRFLLLTDVLSMSVSSRLTAGLMISKDEVKTDMYTDHNY